MKITTTCVDMYVIVYLRSVTLSKQELFISITWAIKITVRNIIVENHLQMTIVIFKNFTTKLTTTLLSKKQRIKRLNKFYLSKISITRNQKDLLVWKRIWEIIVLRHKLLMVRVILKTITNRPFMNKPYRIFFIPLFKLRKNW